MSLQSARMPRLSDRLEEEALARAVEELKEKKEKEDVEVEKAIKKVTSKKR